MTVSSIYNSAVKLLGYNNSYLSVEENDILKKRAVELVNHIGFDLYKMPPVNNFSEEFTLPLEKRDALIYGVCMLISLSEGDGDKNLLFTELYNAKRSEVKSEIAKIADVFPVISEV